MLPKITSEHAVELGWIIKSRMEARGMDHQMLATLMTDALGGKVTRWDINSMIYRGQGLRSLALFCYLQEAGLLDMGKDLLDAKERKDLTA